MISFETQSSTCVYCSPHWRSVSSRVHWPEGYSLQKSARWLQLKIVLKNKQTESKRKLFIKHWQITCNKAKAFKNFILDDNTNQEILSVSERKGTLIKSALDSQRSSFELEKVLGEFSLCFVLFCWGAGRGGLGGGWGCPVLFFFYEIIWIRARLISSGEKPKLQVI